MSGNDDSILEAIERRTGARTRVLLRDGPDGDSPVVRVGNEEDADLSDNRRYRVLGEIGRGGVGVIFKGLDRDLGRNVALKVLRKEHAERPEVVERFIEEAQIGGQLQHPGVVPIYGMGLSADGRPHFAMKLVRGKTLAALLEDRESPDAHRRRFLRIFLQLCQTIAYSHARGVIHRDLKPANVMVGAFGELQVMDWGFAKVLPRDASEAASRRQEEEDRAISVIHTVRSGIDGSQSIAGSVMGTPSYMPPEQATGRISALDERADVFALGAILTEVLTGRPPYTGEGSDPLIKAARAQQDDAIARLDGCEADEELVALAKSCLAPAPEARPRNAGEVAEAVASHLTEMEERARRAELDAVRAREEAEEQRKAAVAERTRVERERARAAEVRRRAEFERARKRRTLTLAAAVLFAIVAAGGAFLWAEADRDRKARAASEAVTEGLARAGQLEFEGRLEEALAAAEKTRHLAAASEVPDRLRRRAEGQHSRLLRAMEDAESSKRRIAENRRFLERLEAIGSWIVTESANLIEGEGPQRAERDYEDAFREWGIVVASLAPEETASRIVESGIAVEVASALDDWTWLRRVALFRPEPEWRPLLHIANLADPDPTRIRLRDAAHGGDLVVLRDLADRAISDGLPEHTCAVVGRALLESWDPNAAASFLEKALRRYPSSLRINHLLASAAPYVSRVAVGDLRALSEAKRYWWDIAERCRTAIVALRPDSATAWWQLGVTQVQTARTGPALDSFRRALELDPDHAMTHVFLGVAFGIRGEWKEAIGKYEDIAGEHAEPARFYTGLSRGLLFGGKRAEALSAIRKAAELTPEEPLVQIYLSIALASTDRASEAVDAARRAVELAPDYPPAYHALARARIAAGDADGAIEAVRKSIGLRRSIGAYDLYLNISEASGRKDEFIAAAREALACFPHVYEFHRGLGRALLESGDASGAVRQFAECCRLRPSSPTEANDLAWSIVSREEVKPEDAAAAARWARLAVGNQPASWPFQNTLALALYRAGDYEAAETALRHSLEIGPRANPLDAFLLSMTLEHRGHASEAKEWYRRAVEWKATGTAGVDPMIHRIHEEANGLVNGTDDDATEGER